MNNTEVLKNALQNTLRYLAASPRNEWKEGEEILYAEIRAALSATPSPVGAAGPRNPKGLTDWLSKRFKLDSDDKNIIAYYLNGLLLPPTGERLTAEAFVNAEFPLYADGHLRPKEDIRVNKERLISLLERFTQFTPSDATKDAFTPCNENDPDVCGSYTSLDGQSLCYVKMATQEAKETVEKFTMPADEDIIRAAILFNDGKLDQDKLTDMVSLVAFIVNRLYENGDIRKPSSKE